MSIDKVSATTPVSAPSVAGDKAQQARSTVQNAQDVAARQRATTYTQEVSRGADPVTLSATATELSQTIKNASSEGEDFDQEKVDRIRRDIRNGHFPINEERLARKFMELEQELGDLRRK